MNPSITKPKINEINEVSIGATELKRYACPNLKKCVVLNGYIDYGVKGRLVYVDCVYGADHKADCVPLDAITNLVYSQGSGFIKHKRGKKGKIMEDILDEFNASKFLEINIPITTNQTEISSFPENAKKSFVMFTNMGLYETALDEETIKKINNKEFVEKYILTVRKIGELASKVSEAEKKGLKDKLVEPFKHLVSYFK